MDSSYFELSALLLIILAEQFAKPDNSVGTSSSVHRFIRFQFHIYVSVVVLAVMYIYIQGKNMKKRKTVCIILNNLWLLRLWRVDCGAEELLARPALPVNWASCQSIWPSASTNCSRRGVHKVRIGLLSCAMWARPSSDLSPAKVLFESTDLFFFSSQTWWRDLLGHLRVKFAWLESRE